MIKKLLIKVLWGLGIGFGLLLFVLILYVSKVNSRASGAMEQVKIGMTPEQVLAKLDSPTEISEMPELHFDSSGVTQFGGIAFEYEFPYFWDYFTLPEYKMLTSLGKVRIKKAQCLRITFNPDKLTVYGVWNKPRNEESFYSQKPENISNHETLYGLPIRSEQTGDVNDKVYVLSRILASRIIDSLRVYVIYTDYLHILKEPLLYNQRNDKEIRVFRLVELMSPFYSTSIRLEIQRDGDGVIYLKQLVPNKNHDSVHMKVNCQIELSKNKVDEFLVFMDKQKFWQLDSKIENDSSYSDIIEGLVDGKYKIVGSSARAQGSVSEITSYFFKLIGIDIDHPATGGIEKKSAAKSQEYIK